MRGRSSPRLPSTSRGRQEVGLRSVPHRGAHKRGGERRAETGAPSAERGGDEPTRGHTVLWLYGRENLPERHREGFAALRAAHLKTRRAYAIKETLRDFWAQDSLSAGAAYGRWRHIWTTPSSLAPVIRVAWMIKNHLAGVLICSDHRIPNAVAEGLNWKIATI